MEHENPAIIFDSGCKLCNSAVKFLKTGKESSGMTFIPARGNESEKILRDHDIPGTMTDKTVILIDNREVYIKSTAIIIALQKRGGWWKLVGIFRLIPAFFRDAVYDWIALHRR